MMINQLNDRELAALAELIRERRQRCEGPAWDRAGIVAALRRSGSGDVLLFLGAAFRAADDPGARTPEAINWPQYWPQRDDGGTTRSAEPRCATCMLPKRGHDHLNRI